MAYDYCESIGSKHISECRHLVDHWGYCSYSWGIYSLEQCSHIFQNDYEAMIEKNLEAPMPWIGMYIAAASAVCTVAMAADAFVGFRTKKLWFPCKYFSLNAFSLTLLTVAMKLTVDLTTSMMGTNDKIANVSSLVMMSTVIGNFMTSVATMDKNEILLNLTALAILVITVAVNVCTHNAETSDVLDGQVVLAEEMGAVVVMLLLLVFLCFYALVIPNTKRFLETKYSEINKEIGLSDRINGCRIDELRVSVKKYWVLAETGRPQFVMARSVISVSSGMMCLLMALTLAQAHVRVRLLYIYFGRNRSNYKRSTDWIWFIQSGGVALGTIAPLFRWFVAVRFNKSSHRYKEWLKMEAYWTESLLEWRESPLPLQIRHYRCRKVVHDFKWFLLNICIGIQTVIVLTSKLLLIFSALWVESADAPLWCYHYIKKNMKQNTNNIMPSRDDMGSSELETNVAYSRCVLLLEGEPPLAKKALENLCDEVDKLIEVGRRRHPKNLVKFLTKSRNFNGVRDFDNQTKVPSLRSDREPPHCWSLPIVTLTSIAIAISSNQKAWRQLVTNVSEGLTFVKLIDKTLDENGELATIRNAADKVWVGVELYRKWQDKELLGTNVNGGRTYKETLQELSTSAEETVADFFKSSSSIDRFLLENPLKWPGKILAANSMYRITQTLLQDEEYSGLQEEEMFDRLSIMISDVLSACLTNLPRVIIKKCDSNSIKERAQNVREAAILLGEIDEILQLVGKLELPRLDPGKAAYIEEWRAVMEKDEKDLVASVSSSHQPSNGPEYVLIQVHEG